MNRADPAPSAPEPAGESAGATPMMAQYLEIKREHPGCLLFYRMGDFYELFFEDAVSAAAALDITLTRRGRHDGDDVPMCGVPVHAADSYLSKLIRQGFKVAICEQVENPAETKRRGAKALVKRAVVRVVTPGTLTEDALLDARRHNFLAALAGASGAMALAWLDMSTGEFHVQPISVSGLPALLSQLSPGEIIAPERMMTEMLVGEVLKEWDNLISWLANSRFDSENGRVRLETQFGVGALEGFGGFTRSEIAAAGALVDYLELTQKGHMPRLLPPRRRDEGARMEIDAATRRNLELTRGAEGGRAGSLLGLIDLTVTGPGARLLSQRLAAPLTDAKAIARRLDAVQFFLDVPKIREHARARLAQVPDLERALSRLSTGRGGPRDLASIREGIDHGSAVCGIVWSSGDVVRPHEIDEAILDYGLHGALSDELRRALADELPLNARDGGFIRPDYAPELDHARMLRDESRRLVMALEQRYRAETKIPTLKIRHNNILGYFVEVGTNQADKMPIGRVSIFSHRQSMADSVRFLTVELSDLAGKISNAADTALATELEYFQKLTKFVLDQADAIAQAARTLARLDVAAALAEVAARRGYCRPVVDESRDFSITNGRHPIVEAALEAAQRSAFSGNDCNLEPDRRLWLLTGPNMAGKSTFLRQNALIAVLAQAGSYVPAAAARIGVVDRLFSRVGAADDLARGRSTFMVEMVETAAILNQAGARALVILDEIGRGTATFDGLSIAWATIEHLHEVNGCRTLFATHFHELTALAAKLPALALHTMRVKEWQGDIVFLHEVAPGAAEASYGIHVARLAGLPQPVIGRAEDVLALLEKGEQAGALAGLAEDLPLFSATLGKARPSTGASPLEISLGEVDVDSLSPREALELVYRLKALAASGREE